MRAILVLALLMPLAATADERGPAYRLSFEVDGPLLLIGGGIATSFFFRDETAPPACAPLCDRSNLNALDRFAAGNYSSGWGSVGDITAISIIAAVPLTLVVAQGLGPGLNDWLVVAEAVLWTSAIQVPISFAIRRPRPRLYGEKAPLDSRNDADAGRSFFSGHVADGVAATVATAITFHKLRRPALAWTVLSVGLAASTLVAVARVAGGNHFPTDNLAGAAVGTGMGIVIPALHGSRVHVAPLAAGGGGGLTLTGAF